MKCFKTFLTFTVFLIPLMFSSCSEPTNNISSTPSNQNHTDNSSLITYSSEWNTTLLQNQLNNGGFFYDGKTEDIYYCKAETTNEQQSYSLVVRSGTQERKIIDAVAYSIYVTGDTIYYSDDTDILSIQTDGTNKKTISKDVTSDYSARYIYPYQDSLLFLSDDWKIHQIKTDGSDEKVIGTSENVFYYMIYNECIYYAGFSDELSNTNSLRCLNLKTQEDTEIKSKIAGFDILNDTIYSITEDGDVICSDLDGSNQKTLFSDNANSIYATEKGILYFSHNNNNAVFKRFHLDSKKTDTICDTLDLREWSVCGDYLCSYSPYELNGQMYSFKKVF